MKKDIEALEVRG